MNLRSLLCVCLLAIIIMASAEPFPYADLSGPDGRVTVRHDADADGDLDLRDVAASHVRETFDRQLAELRDLKPLRKIHYCWPVERNQLIARDPRLFEYVRITGSLGIRGEWWHANNDGLAEMRAAVEMCQPYGATLAVNYSPWHNIVGDSDGSDPRVTGPKYDREINGYRTSLQMIKERLASMNAELGADVRVAVLLLDTEIFVVKPDDEPGAEEWNAAIDAKLNPFYSIGKQVFPDAPVEWFARGTTQASWKRFTGRELGDGYSCDLYHVPQPTVTRDRMKWAVKQVPRDAAMMVWIDLAAGNVPYPLRTSYQLGAELNIPYYGNHPAEYAPWHAAETVAFYPGPFHPKYPQWTWHFIEYVKGATE